MDSTKPTIVRRALAVLVLGLVAVVALRLVVGFVAGLVTAIVWLLVVMALAGAFFWARSSLRSGRRERGVASSRTREISPEDRVEAEMHRITEQLRKQGRR